jgi:urea transport system permease protein
VVVWVATGGRGTLIGALLGAVGINAARSLLTASYPEWWPIILGGLFVGVVILFPDGLVGIPNQLRRRVRRARTQFLGHPGPGPALKKRGRPHLAK